MYYSEVQIVILLYGLSLVNGFFHFRHLFEHEQSVSFIKSTRRSDPTHWIDQRVDHFNYRDRRAWKQKYYQVMRSWKPEGPIILFLGGEGTLYLRDLEEIYWNDYGEDSQSLMGQIAVETGAAFFMLEHRYYGESQPFVERTTENLAFLSSRQALADAAYLLLTIKKTPEFQNSKVMVFGGSYAGNLAAWMKLLYPQLIDAVLASSAPVLAKKDFNEYLETVTDTFRKYGSQGCVNNITERFNTLHESLQRSEGIEKLKVDNFICDDVDMRVPEHQQLFFYEILGSYQEVAQYGTPANVSSTCRDFDLFYPRRTSFSFWDDENNCSAYNFNTWINFMMPNARAWWYQTCTEFGYFQSTSSKKHMFGNTVPVDLFYKTCRMAFGEEFNEERVDQGVINTNIMYGGLTPNVTNVVFVNGDMDPWHRLGIVHDLSPDAPAIVIKGSSHCHDNQPDPSDTEHIKEARKIIKNLLKNWIGERNV